MKATFTKALAEFLGVCVFVTAITASELAFKPIAIASTLAVMILLTSPISGSHLNPVVSLYFYAKRQMLTGTFLTYVAAQIAGAFAGAALGVMLLGGKLVGFSASTAEVSTAALVGEALATAGLVWVFATLVSRKQEQLIPIAVAGWVMAAVIFTPTGAQANPAVTLALMLQGYPANQGSLLIIAQLIGLIVGMALLIVFSTKPKRRATKK